MHGLDHGPRSGIPILRSCATKVGIVHDLGMYGFILDNSVPMVFLGLFAGLQLDGYEWIYRRLRTFRSDECPGNAISRITVDS